MRRAKGFVEGADQLRPITQQLERHDRRQENQGERLLKATPRRDRPPATLRRRQAPVPPLSWGVWPAGLRLRDGRPTSRARLDQRFSRAAACTDCTAVH